MDLFANRLRLVAVAACLLVFAGGVALLALHHPASSPPGQAGGASPTPSSPAPSPSASPAPPSPTPTATTAAPPGPPTSPPTTSSPTPPASPRPTAQGGLVDGP